MTGIEKSKFVSLPQSLEEELTCGICLNILNNPMTTPCCRHSYCRQCILQSLQMSCNPNSCPNDRKQLLFTNLLMASRIVTNILDKQEVYCDFKTYGCPQVCQLAQLSQHRIKCGFDPNKSSNNCIRVLENVSKCMNKLKSKAKLGSVREEVEQLRQQVERCCRDVKVMASQTKSDTIFVLPNTENFINKVLESAKKAVEEPEVIESNIDDKSAKKNVIKRCKEAIGQSSDYNQIGEHLIQCLNDETYQWSAFVFPKNSAYHSVTNFVDKMELNFGDLSIVLVSHYTDDDNYTDDIEGGDDYYDIGDDDDDEEDYEDWVPTTWQ